MKARDESNTVEKKREEGEEKGVRAAERGRKHKPLVSLRGEAPS
jgi:hypothetical protein